MRKLTDTPSGPCAPGGPFSPFGPCKQFSEKGSSETFFVKAWHFQK